MHFCLSMSVLIALNDFLSFLTYENPCQFSRQSLNPMSSMKTSLRIKIKINVPPFQTKKIYDTWDLALTDSVHWNTLNSDSSLEWRRKYRIKENTWLCPWVNIKRYRIVQKILQWNKWSWFLKDLTLMIQCYYLKLLAFVEVILNPFKMIFSYFLI